MFKKLFKIKENIKNGYDHIENNLESYWKIVREINQGKMEELTDYQLKVQSSNLKEKAGQGAKLEELIVEAFALVREASRRIIGMYPFEVQLIAGIGLHQEKIIEMQTGEGKTLSAVMPAYLNALTGKGVHILTFNHYLAQRDAQWMGPIFEFLGLRTSYITENMTLDERKIAYQADVTYVTAREAGFDYLRDFLAVEPAELVHRPFHFAIVDEADSILIDEAGTPLILAGDMSVQEEQDVCRELTKIVRSLHRGIDYEIDHYGRTVSLTDAGISIMEKLLVCETLFSTENLELLEMVNSALHAEVLLQRDKDYIVRQGRIELVDEFTGRIADKRKWPEKMQAAVEAKERIAINSGGIILGNITMQHFLSLYPKISGMTGTAKTSAREFYEFYAKEVIVIPPNKTSVRHDHLCRIFDNKEDKRKAILLEIQKANQNGQPVLLGTASVEESEQMAIELSKMGVESQVLNARNDEREAEIIARAGEQWAVTVSTNMAGRGVDIRLGGVREEKRKEVVEAGGLYVIGTNLNESRRIDNQLRGRAGRQGDPGETRFFISLEDDLIKKYNIDKLIQKHIFSMDDESKLTKNPKVIQDIEHGQRVAEGYNEDIRRQLWKYSSVIEQQRRIVYAKRQAILLDKEVPQLLVTSASEEYHEIQKGLGKIKARKFEKQLTLYYINICWAEYLDHMAYVRESIHLVSVGRQNPLDEFIKKAIISFDMMWERINSQITQTFKETYTEADILTLESMGIKRPSSTWTYLINDDINQFSKLPLLEKLLQPVLRM